MPSPAVSPTAPSDATELDYAVLEGLGAHRDALRSGDSSTVDGTLDRAARRPSERDLLIDLIAAEGLRTAASKVGRFWRQAVTDVEAVRRVGEHEAEVYERLTLPGGDRSMDVVTLLRRGEDDAWRVVTTQRAPADVLRARLLGGRQGALDATRVTQELHTRWGRVAELVMAEDGDGVLGHPDRDWVGAVQGVDGALEVALVPALDTATRREQMVWLSRCLVAIAQHVGAKQAWMPHAHKLIGVEQLEEIAEAPSPSSRALIIAWAGMARDAERVYTVGLRAFGLPELVASSRDWNGSPPARKVIAAVARSAVGGATQLVAGRALSVGAVRAVLSDAPRGPAPGSTYGRFGAVLMRPLRAATVTDSGVVRRLGD